MSACTPKAFDVSAVRFASYYVGTKIDVPESEIVLVNEGEEKLIRAWINITNWTKVDRTSKVILDPDVVLFDDQGNTFYISDKTKSMILIRLVTAQKKTIYYEVAGDIVTYKNEQFIPLTKTINAKKVLLNVSSLSVWRFDLMPLALSKFNLDSSETTALKDGLRIQEWVRTTTSGNISGNPIFFLILPDDTHVSVGRNTGGFLIAEIPDAIENVKYYYSLTQADHAFLNEFIDNKITEYYSPVEVYLKDAVFTKAYLWMELNEKIPEWVFDLSASNQQAAVNSLKVSDWQKIKPESNLDLSQFSPYLSLTDTLGHQIELGYSDGNPIAKVTMTSDPAFLEWYVTLDVWYESTVAFSELWTTGFPTQEIKDFRPTTLRITVDWDEIDGGTYADFALSSTNRTKIIQLLNIASWRVDANYNKYAFGWIQNYTFTDKENRTFLVFNYYDSTVIRVKGVIESDDPGVWFVAPHSVFENLKTYIDAKYPTP